MGTMASVALVQKTVHLTVDDEAWRSFRVRCLESGRSIAAVLADVVGGVAESGRKRPVANGEIARSAGSNPASTAGEVAERSKAPVSKTDVGHSTGGSNPSLSAHEHSKVQVTQNGVWVCSCEAVSIDNGRSWRGGVTVLA